MTPNQFNSPKVGVSFSHHQAQSLELDVPAALKTCLTWPIEYVRLGAYWSEIEKAPGEYDCSALAALLKICEKTKRKVVLTVGVKAPRWPEFYLPEFVSPRLRDPDISKKVLAFVAHVVKVSRKFRCISHWQVENEPLLPSGPARLTVPIELLTQECQLVRSLDDRPIIVTTWGNGWLGGGQWRQLESLADVIGVDLYYHQFLKEFFNRSFYRGPWRSDEWLATHFQRSQKPVWITELQAEPWEADQQGFQARFPKSISPTQLRANWQRVKQMPVETVLFWGAEYWLWRAKYGDPRYLNFICELS